MILIHERKGQLGNRLLLGAYALALAEATGQTVIDLNLAEYAEHFPAARPVFSSSRAQKQFRKHTLSLLKRLRRFNWGRSCFVQLDPPNTGYQFTDSAYVAAVKRRWLTIIEGWFDVSQLTLPDSDVIRKKFKPKEAVLTQARDLTNQTRPEGGVLIGLHIRRGDYATWNDGIHFYPLEFWPRVMAALSAFFPGQKVAFIICSNETLDPALFSGFSFTFGPGTIIGDLYTLAQCDYLLGPPSTYSLWAAYYGRKPLHHLSNQQPPSSLAEFQLPLGIGKLE